jgi:hypothetical protein
MANPRFTIGKHTPGQSSPILHNGCGSQYVLPGHGATPGPHLTMELGSGRVATRSVGRADAVAVDVGVDVGVVNVGVIKVGVGVRKGFTTGVQAGPDLGGGVQAGGLVVVDDCTTGGGEGEACVEEGGGMKSGGGVGGTGHGFVGEDVD